MAVRNCPISIKWPRNFASTVYRAVRQYQRREGTRVHRYRWAHTRTRISRCNFTGTRPSYGIYISRYLSRVHAHVCRSVLRRDNFRVEKLTFAARQPRKRGIFHSGRSFASFLASWLPLLGRRAGTERCVSRSKRNWASKFSRCARLG